MFERNKVDNVEHAGVPVELTMTDGELVRRVRSTGEIRWKGALVFVSEAVVGEPVGVRQRQDGHWLVRFANVPLMLIDRTGERIARFGPGRPPRPKANINQP